MTETAFHKLADTTLDILYDILEQADESGLLDVEYQDGIMTIRLPSNQHYIINKHAVSREIWVSSPMSGGLHFKYDGDWKLPDGRTFQHVLTDELRSLANIEIHW